MIDPSHITSLKERSRELESQFADPALAADQKKYQACLKEHARLKRILQHADHYSRLTQTIKENAELLDADELDEDLRDMAQDELTQCEDQLPAVEKALMVMLLPPDPQDERNAIVEIRAGTGGDEAAIFAGDLFRMYQRFCDEQGWSITVMDSSVSSVGGYKEVVFLIEGDEIYRRLKYESGTHRVQRIPATESQGRIHTSASTVGVFPEAEEQDDIDLPADELRIDLYCASGPGGQHVNTTQSAVRITHIPTGIVAQSQDNRSQHRNRDQAMAVLKARVLDHFKRQEEAKLGAERRSKIGSGDRSERIRTYNFPQNRLTDHRINLTLYSLDRIMEGELDELLEALYTHDMEQRLHAELSSRS
jgi:peptide chain release factor 1